MVLTKIYLTKFQDEKIFFDDSQLALYGNRGMEGRWGGVKTILIFFWNKTNLNKKI